MIFSSLLSSLRSPSIANGFSRTLAQKSPLGIGLVPTPSTALSRVFAPVASPLTLQTRSITYGNTFQPSTLKKKRRYGFLKRLRTYGGRMILKRRMVKGRWKLTH
ncbi:ribosomal protein L34-domain-containing protein [Polychytrium aggregatum]|uniref:ribosomal protein L34-domain-containing protein n=1 Tax=Polychytrium aggregatum TaxID=110093 RepID=UPI0022FDB5C9|nr:ribosomal protein L34-domain-containing protein [Polychytrium aggregatum]KAI9204633.1 ribosomal protein L34-domain-containing protein [Polychytrium aggregatum]